MFKRSFLLGFILIFAFSCTSVKPKYRKGEPTSNFGYPENKKITKSFYLLGDGGYSPAGGASKALIAFQDFMKEQDGRGNYAFFLGDNVYPDGMPVEGAPDRKQAEYRLDVQLKALENFQGKVLYIPGNHDWYSERIAGLDRQEQYLKNKFGDSLIWSPKTGCGLEVKKISKNIKMLIIDSQWYLEDWDKSPNINKGCGIRTREDFFKQIDEALYNSNEELIIIAQHHPVFSNGIHGGKYNFNRHLYPTEKKIPIPLLGSLAMVIRTSGGVSIQDLQNERYKSLNDHLKNLVKERERVLFISGHEHTLQYIENSGMKQIVSGSGSKTNFVALGNDGLFAYSMEGFAVLDVFEDGSAWVSYYRNHNDKAEILYRKQVFDAPVAYDYSPFVDQSFPKTIDTTILSEKELQNRKFKTLWAQENAKVFGKKMTFPVANLDSLYGGLKPVSRNYSSKAREFRLKDSLDRVYSMKKIKSDTVESLSDLVNRQNPLDGQVLENSNTPDDLYTSSNPFTRLAIPELSKAINLPYSKPKFYYVPKQRKLGELNDIFGDEVLVLEDYPDSKWYTDSLHQDIISTDAMQEHLRDQDFYKIDEEAYVKARIFDMLVGDWDRGDKSWRWEITKDAKDDRITFKPIPINRDHVFSNYDGAFLNTLRTFVGFTKKFSVYNENLSNLKWFNSAATGLDRSILKSANDTIWEEQAKFIQKTITDSVIQKAFASLPEEVQGDATNEIIEKMKERRDNIVEIAKNYYELYAKLAILTATDEDDVIKIKRENNGKTSIAIYQKQEKGEGDLIGRYSYDHNITKNIWLYGLNGDDDITISGEGDNLISIRLIGGRGHDTYDIQNGKGLIVYDYQSQPNSIENSGQARIDLSDAYDQNTYNKNKHIFSTTSFYPGIGYNPDHGFRAAVQMLSTLNNFEQHPFTTQHEYNIRYHSATQGFLFDYTGRFANVLGNYNLEVGAHFNTPDFTRNFFGFGNETPNLQESRSFNYNRVRISEIGIDAGLVNETPFGSFFSGKFILNSYDISEKNNGYINESEDFTAENGQFDRKFFAGVDALYRYESYDDITNPTRGMKFELNLGGRLRISHPAQNFGYFKSYLGFYNSLSQNRRLVFKSHAQTHLNIGTGYEFYQAASLGSENGLRGYRIDRFSGKSLFSTGGDLRYSFPRLKTAIFPVQIGAYGGYDLGRVWMPDENSKKWYDSYGGGIFVNSASDISGDFSLFKGENNWRFEFGLGFKF